MKFSMASRDIYVSLLSDDMTYLCPFECLHFNTQMLIEDERYKAYSHINKMRLEAFNANAQAHNNALVLPRANPSHKSKKNR